MKTIDEIRDLPTVVERLAAAGPSGVRGPHCWFCGKIAAWFQCDCKDSQDARDGKRAKPRWDNKHSVIILDEEIIERNVAWGFKRTAMAAPESNEKPPKAAKESNKPAQESNAEANREPDEPPESNAGANSAPFDRAAYQRDLMRKRRAQQKKDASGV